MQSQKALLGKHTGNASLIAEIYEHECKSQKEQDKLLTKQRRKSGVCLESGQNFNTTLLGQKATCAWTVGRVSKESLNSLNAIKSIHEESFLNAQCVGKASKGRIILYIRETTLKSDPMSVLGVEES